MNDYIPDPISTYNPRKPVLRPLPPVETENTPINHSDLSRLEDMTREELIALCGRFAGQCGLSATMTEEEIAQAMLDVLAETALKPIIAGLNVRADIMARMAAIDKWLDRTKGKAIQRIDQRIEHRTKGNASDMTNDQIMAILIQANVAGLLPAGMAMGADGLLVTDADYSVITDNQ